MKVFILSILFSFFAGAVLACCNDDPVPGTYKGGDRVIETVEITVCATAGHWKAISERVRKPWWGEAFADTGKPTKRWLKIGPVKAQCRTRNAPIGSRVGTKFEDCENAGWHWTDPITGPGTYFMTDPIPNTVAKAAG